MPDYADVWEQYDQAVSNLYQQLAPATRGAQPQVLPADLSRHADVVIATSSRLAEVLAEGLESPRVEEREQCMLRLMAGAAADLAIASDLIGSEAGQREVSTPTDTTTFEDLMSDLGPILRPGTGGQPRTTRDDALELSVEAVEQALSQLRSAAACSFDAISDDVIDIGQTAVNALASLPVEQIQKAASVVVQEILNFIADNVGDVMRRVALLVIQAYDKILKALGKDRASQAQLRSAEWVQTLRAGTALERIMADLYEKQRILDDIDTQARQYQDALLSDAFAEALDRTGALAVRFEAHRKTLTWILRGSGIIKAGLFPIQPWGPLVVTAIYVATLGYTVYAGGDYVDWFKTDQIQPLDRIPGLRHVVPETLGSPDSRHI